MPMLLLLEAFLYEIKIAIKTHLHSYKKYDKHAHKTTVKLNMKQSYNKNAEFQTKQAIV